MTLFITAFNKARRLLIVSALLLISLLPAASGAVSLTLLHTNDTHGRILPFSYPALVDPGSPEAGLPERHDIGGMARRAALVRQIRQESKEKGITVWLMDAGDFSDGTPFSTKYRGEADIAAMNAAGYDFATLGNHDFNYPLAQTRKLIEIARYPVLCANAVFSATGKPLTETFKIALVDSVRVGIFGLVTKETASYPAAQEGLEIADEIASARKMVAELRSKADIIVLISHCGEEMDKKIAKNVAGIDVIVGGHSHSRLPSGEFIWRSQDLMVNDVNGTIILQAHQWGGELGRCDLLFEKDASGQWHVDRYRARLIPITAAIQPDPGLTALIAQYWDPIAAFYNEIMGRAAADFTSRYNDLAEYHLMADAIRETFGTEIEMENMGGVRAPLIKGDITRGDLIAMDPFNNTVVLFKISGLQLREVLKKHTPAVSGLRYRLENGDLREVSVNGRPLQDSRLYSGAANSYFAGKALKTIETWNTKKPRLDVLTEYIRKKGTVYPKYDGRRVVLGE